MKNTSKGITLIALVVTIIVLIVLAAVSVNVVFGENGIINKSKEARNNYSLSAQMENEQLANIEAFSSEIAQSNAEEDDSKKKLALTAYRGLLVYPENGTVGIKKNETGGVITVESDNPNIVNATYDAETKIITITCVNQLGEATITVKSAATEVEEEQTAEYKVTVVKGENDLALSSYGPDQIKPSRTRNVIVTKNASEGAISITSTNSNRAIGTYDEVNKKIIVTTGTEQGEATLTITTAETALYKSKTVEYKVEVSETAPPVLVASNITSTNVRGSYYDEWYVSGGYSNSRCSTCSGTGSITTPIECSKCSGTGKVTCTNPAKAQSIDEWICLKCNTRNWGAYKCISCSKCGAKGYSYATGSEGCHNCGAYKFSHGKITCSTCNGNGNTGSSSSTCSNCNGSGTVSTYHSGYWTGTTRYSNFGTVTIDSTTNDDGTITLTANTPSNVTVNSYSWSGAGSGNTQSITVSGPGTYTLTVSMSSGSYTGSGSVSATIIED